MTASILVTLSSIHAYRTGRDMAHLCLFTMSHDSMVAAPVDYTDHSHMGGHNLCPAAIRTAGICTCGAVASYRQGWLDYVESRRPKQLSDAEIAADAMARQALQAAAAVFSA